MKKILFFATALIALASCTSDDFTGETPRPTQNGEGVISFNSTAKTVTRGNAADAALLNNEFIFAGTKGTSPESYVFDQYRAKFVDNSANTTESNSSNWEYVGLLPASTTHIGATTVQTIKYWDYSAPQYDFAAYSLGTGSATASAIAANNKSFTLEGTADQLKACYISNLVSAYNADNDYGKPVQFVFRSLATKIRFALYETIPGYSVKDVQFYSVATEGSASSTPTLFTGEAVLPSGSGKMTITYPTTGYENKDKTDYNKAHVTFTASSTGTNVSSTVTFDNLANYATAEHNEGTSSTGWLGRASNAATYAGVEGSPAVGKYYTVLPYETGANLQLRIKYTMVSTDGSGETITVDNATAVVPAEFAKWNPNYAYTYIFKISDMTNGSTGTDGDGNIVTGLTPITLDAVVVDSEDGVQETITTVSNPSITTYAKGKVVTNYDEYIVNVPVYIIVYTGTENATLTDKVKLFTVTQEAGTGASANPAQNISESSVDNAYINDTDNEATTWSVTDANGWVLTLTESSLELVNVIDAADSPTGNEINIGTKKVAKFTPTTAGTYAFQYQVTAPSTQQVSAAEYNAALPGAISTNDEAFSFTSWDDNQGTTQYGTGKVKVISRENGWTTVLVISNTVDGFVGKQYMVHATSLVANTYYQLYSTNGTAQQIYVTVGTTSITAEEVTTYNAKLPGAVTTAQTVNVPGKYQYKIIKVQ